MANMRTSFADYLYNRLPQVYRTSDTEQILRRFIETFAEAGFDPLLQETMDIMNLLDVEKCPSEFLPLLCSLYGFEYTVEIPELFIRRLLKHIIELYKRKGTKSVVKFIARELTGFDSEIIENKDFDEELIDITKWDIRFEHYRNFVLKLNAPYEDSMLYNREEIVHKLLEDFLPTNSQVFVITVYWFKEDSDIIANAVEHGLHEIVREYNEEIAKLEYVFSDVKYSLTENIEEYIHRFIGEETSEVVDSIPQTTNILIHLLDKLKMNEGAEEHIREVTEGKETYATILYESDLIKNTSDFSYLESKHKTSVLDTYDTQKQGLINVTHLTEVSDVHSFENSPSTLSSEFSHVERAKDFADEELEVGRIYHKSCDIISENTTEELETLFKQQKSENSFLNVHNPLFTNGLVNWDVVKENGKEDRIVLL